MNKIFLCLCLLLSLSIKADELKYHFRDCVRIISGFYIGCKGYVEEPNRQEQGYYIYIEDCKGKTMWLSVKEIEIEKIECKKD